MSSAAEGLGWMAEALRSGVEWSRVWSGLRWGLRWGLSGASILFFVLAMGVLFQTGCATGLKPYSPSAAPCANSCSESQVCDDSTSPPMCVCRSGFMMDSLGDCVALDDGGTDAPTSDGPFCVPESCGEYASFDEVTCECACDSGLVGDPMEGCECPLGQEMNEAGECVCPTFMRLAEDGLCECTPPMRGSLDLGCACPGDLELRDGECGCPEGLVRAEDGSERCLDLCAGVECGRDFETCDWETGICACDAGYEDTTFHCEPTGPIYQWVGGAWESVVISGVGPTRPVQAMFRGASEERIYVVSGVQVYSFTMSERIWEAPQPLVDVFPVTVSGSAPGEILAAHASPNDPTGVVVLARHGEDIMRWYYPELGSRLPTFERLNLPGSECSEERQWPCRWGIPAARYSDIRAVWYDPENAEGWASRVGTPHAALTACREYAAAGRPVEAYIGVLVELTTVKTYRWDAGGIGCSGPLGPPTRASETSPFSAEIGPDERAVTGAAHYIDPAGAASLLVWAER